LILFLSTLGSVTAFAGKLVLVDLPDIAPTTTVGTGPGKCSIFKKAGSVDGVSIDLVARLAIAKFDHMFAVTGGK
jgi:hypothetical protein